MEAGGGQSQDHIACCHAAGVDHLGLVHQTDGEACQIVVICRHSTGVLCGFSADESAACTYAALCYAGDNGCYLFGDILADCNIVKEEQGLCAAANNIVYAHCNAVNADGIMLVHKLSQSQLGADTVGAGNQYRLSHACHIGSKQAAEAANVRNYTGDMGALNCLTHQLYAFVACGYIYAGCGVCCGMGVFHLKTSELIVLFILCLSNSRYRSFLCLCR